MAKVAIYARVSTLNQADEGYSIQGQVESLTKYCEAMSWTIHDTYIDAGFSGGKLERPEINRLINDVKLKKFDTVLVYKLDRLSRNVKDTLFLVKEIFTDNDIHFVSLKENIDTSSAMGSLFLTLLSAIAEFEREQIKERMMFGKLGRAKSGKTMSWTTSPYGYTYDKEQGKLIAIPSQAIVVKKLFDYYISGMSIANMLRKMNAEEQVGRTAEWSINAMKNILRNEVYYGMVKYRGQLFKGEHEPFISKKTFELAQIERERRKQYFSKKFKNTSPFKAKYMLSGLLRCGCCGQPLISNVQRKSANGRTNIFYQCKERYNKDLSKRCTESGRFRKEILEEFVINELSKIKINNKYVENFSKDEPKIDINNLKKEINSIEQKLEKVSELYIDGIVTRDILIKKSEKLIKQKEFIQKQIDEMDTVSEKDKMNIIKKTIDRWNPEKTSYEDTTLLVRKLVKYIVVDEERIDIFLNF
ncbi:recombinase family protein [Streptococcus uberis]|uniref:recombinase family protein n=1 Tax=Streptococcus uberis TaxID=1349 RepID=UPI001FF5008B|nr:recombinase family protein [Streptococcus uberis]MCK1187768.1 recombinase family protein [Streptococcus uberis]